MRRTVCRVRTRHTSSQSPSASGKKGGRRALNSNFIRKGQAPTADNSEKLQREAEQDVLDAKCGFKLFRDGPPKLGWLINYNACSVEDKETERVASAVACYFMCQTGEMFKCKLPFAPYFYLQIKGDRELEVEAYLRRKFEGAQARCVHAYGRHAQRLRLRRHASAAAQQKAHHASHRSCGAQHARGASACSLAPCECRTDQDGVVGTP